MCTYLDVCTDENSLTFRHPWYFSKPIVAYRTIPTSFLKSLFSCSLTSPFVPVQYEHTALFLKPEKSFRNSLQFVPSLTQNIRCSPSLSHHIPSFRHVPFENVVRSFFWNHRTYFSYCTWTSLYLLNPLYNFRLFSYPESLNNVPPSLSLPLQFLLCPKTRPVDISKRSDYLFYNLLTFS